MVWRNRAWTAGALLLCTSMLIGAQPANTAKSVGEQAQILDNLGEAGQLSSVSEPSSGSGITVLRSGVVEPKDGLSTFSPENAGATAAVSNVDTAKLEAHLVSETAEQEMEITRGLRACGDCLTPNVDLGDISTVGSPWGGSISGDCSVEGKWYASFTAIAGVVYHFDLCEVGTSASDLDLKIADASCAILVGVDGSSTCSNGANWNAADFTWTAPADGTYHVILAPYNSISVHNCTGDGTDAFTLAYYADSGCVGNEPVNDDCENAVVTALADGVPAVITGDNTCATQQGGCFTSGGEGEAWEAITLPASAAGWDVTLDFCDTAAGWGNTWLNVALDCPCTTVSVAADFETTTCANGNVTMTWSQVPAGTYYFPVMRDPTNGAEGAYTLNVVATEYVPPACCPVTTSTYPACEDFEAGIGDFVNSDQDVLEWTANQGPTGSSNTGPSVDHTIGDATGTYFYVETSGTAAGDTAILESPCYDLSPLTSPRLTFWYHMFGAGMGNLQAEISTDDCLTWTQVFTQTGDQGDQWYLANVDLSAYAGMTVKFRWTLTVDDANGFSFENDAALDDICVEEAQEFTGACCFDDGSCSELTATDCATSNGIYSGDGTDCSPNLCPQPCTCDVTTGGFCTDFGDAAGDLGLWTQSADDDFDWTLLSGATGSTGTGPSGDHTTGSGFYAYIETSSGSTGDEAILDGPCVDLSLFTNPAVAFWYHMWGATIDTLSFEVSTDNCLTWDTVWSLSGDQGDAWFFAQADLSAYAGQTVHVRFVAARGSSFTGDIALDDICFQEFGTFDGGCCDVDTGNCLGVMDEATCLGLGNTLWYILADCTSNNFCPQPPPDNDDCTGATDITSLPFEDIGVNFADATDDLDVSCNSSSCTVSANGVWYTYTPTADCEASITVAGDDTFIAVFTGTDCSSLGEEACSDPQTLTYDLMAGTQYWILVGDWSCSGSPTTIDVSIDCVDGACCSNGFCTVGTPTDCSDVGGTYVGDGTDCTGDPCTQGACCIGASCTVVTEMVCSNGGGIYQGDGTTCETAVCNDDCDVAEPVTDGLPAAEGDNCAAGPDILEAGCQSNSNLDVWYEYTASCTGTVTIDTEGSGQSDTVLSVWGACTNGAELACDDDGGTSLLSTISYNTVAGTTVLVRVASYSTGCGDYDLNIVCDEAPQGACCNGGACTIDYQLTCEAAGGVYAGDLTACAGDDCNLNGADDACEILEDPSVDCNANAIPDDCDISGATSMDCDGNGTPDECDPDCNENGIVDGCDISCAADCSACYGASCGVIDDCQPDGIPDDCQLGDGGARALQYLYDDGTQENSLGITAGADICALQRYIVAADAETIVSIEMAWGNIPAASAGTMYLWSDPNGDGDPSDAQVLASGAAVANDPDNNVFEVYPITPTYVGPAGTSFFVGFLMASTGFPAGMDEDGTLADESWIVGDTAFGIDPNDLASAAYSTPLDKFSGIGFPANLMVRANGEAVVSGADCNTNGVPDECDIADCADPLGDPNCSDCDANGVVDICEYVDCDGSGTHDACDILQGADDCDSNGVPDKCDPDCDGNDIPDACEPDQSDCNENSIIDLCDIASGFSDDCQPDGVPDECQLGEVGGIVLSEGFENTVPPVDWTLVAQNTAFTWKAQAASAGEGLQSADVEYDPALTPQNEWLLTPTLSLSGTVTLTGWTMGSIYWGRDTFDNYDIQVWTIVGALDGVDDSFIGLLDDYWPDNYVWTQFSSSFAAPASDFRIGFLYTGVDGAQGGIDGIAVEGVAGTPLNDCDQDGIPDDCQLCGDLDRDGNVDVDDYNAFRAAFASSTGDANFVPCFDFDNDGQIGLKDYRAWLECYRDYIGNPLAGPPTSTSDGMIIKPRPTRTGTIGGQVGMMQR